jgi:hypothetical protein
VGVGTTFHVELPIDLTTVAHTNSNFHRSTRKCEVSADPFAKRIRQRCNATAKYDGRMRPPSRRGLDRPIIDALRAVLGGTVVGPERIRDALRACLELAPSDDPDVRTLRMLVDGETLDEFRSELARLRRNALQDAKRTQRLPRV